MKKIIAIIGSPRKKYTYQIVQEFEHVLNDIEKIQFEYILLKDMKINNCKGCFSCLIKGEEFCPAKDEILAIRKKMQESDGVIFAVPVYSIQVPGIMKTFYDRLAFIFHRPEFFGKSAIGIVTQGAYGGKSTLKYIEEVSKFWGFNTVKGIKIMTSEKPDDKSITRRKKIIEKSAKRFYESLGKLYKPTFKDILIFRFVRSAKPSIAEEYPRDYQYFMDKGWLTSDYFFNGRIGICKKIFGAIVDSFAKRMFKK